MRYDEHQESYMCMLHHLPSSAALLPGISDLDLEEEGLPTTDELVEHYCKVRDHTDGNFRSWLFV